MNNITVIHRCKSFAVAILFCCLLVSGGSMFSFCSLRASQDSQAPTKQPADATASNAPDKHRRATPSLLIPLLILLQADGAAPLQKPPAAVPHLSSLKVTGPAEKLVIESVHEGREANLNNMKDRRLSAEFVNTLLFRTAASAIPSKLVSIRGATVQGELSVPRGSILNSV